MLITPILRFSARIFLLAFTPIVAGTLPCHGNLEFDTRRLTETFYSEGAGVGDFNKDGNPDVVSGPYWYAGPEFRERHEIYQPEPFPTKAYSKNFLCEAYDIDSDGWDDVLVLGFPGEDAYWFQNPKEAGKEWMRYSVLKPLDNESPYFIDLTGDGKPEILCSQHGKFGYASPDWADPAQPWRFISISDQITGERFTHGLGIGDINGDGRMDVLHKGGWLEQPKDLRLAEKWDHHAFNFTGPGGSQMFAYDFDGDGDNDVLTSLAAHSYGLGWFEQQEGDDGAITFKQHRIMGASPDEKPFGVSFSQAHAIDLVDMDGDGLKDIVTGKRYFAHGGKDPGGKDPAVLYWFKTVRKGKAGEVAFEPNMIHGDSGVGTQVKAIDVTGDGHPDVVVGNKKGTHVHVQKRAARAQASFQSIFDGETLKGWEGDEKRWTVKDGAITAESTADQPLDKNTFIFWRGGELNDFELKLEFRLSGSPQANSGVQIRSQEHADGSMSGYQADIDHGTTWLGCLYDEHARGMLAKRGFKVGIHPDGSRVEVAFADADALGKFYKKEDWNQYHIRAVGPIITLSVNGQLMSETVDNQPGERDYSGKLALQLHSGPASMIQFRNIQLKNLGKTALPDSEKKKVAADRAAGSLISADGAVRADDSKPPAPSAPARLAAEKMTVPDGFFIDPIAAEPGILQPIAFTIDERGRLWVVEGHTYPKRAPDGQGNDRILIFEDSDHNGSFETRKVFMEGLNLVSGIEVGFGGVWVGAAPYFMFIADRDRDDKPDGEPRILLDGWGYHDTHETLNSFTWGPDGWLYGCHGVFTHSRVGKPGTPDEERVPLNCAYWRYHPIDHEFEIFAQGTSNSWGIDFNARGQLFAEACVIPHFWHVIQGGYYLRQSNPLGHFNKHVYTNIDTIADHRHYIGATPHAGNGNSDSAGGGHAHCGLSIYLGDNFPDEYRGRPMMFNLHGHRINQEQLSQSGSGWIASHGPDLMVSHDQQFMGIDMKYGPEGTVYFIDWYDEQTCHQTLPEVWDRSNGRVYRMRFGQPAPRPVDLHARSDEELADLHSEKNDWFARTARRILQHRAATGRGISGSAIGKLERMLGLNSDVTLRLRALWALHSMRVLEEERLIELLRDNEAYIRAWAIQLLMEDRSKSAAPPPRVIHYLTYLARKDPSPVVRLYVASALQRLPAEYCWNIIEGLASHAEDASDHNLPQMIWFGAEPHVLDNPRRALRIAADSKIPLLADHIARRASADAAARDAVLAAAMNSANPEFQEALLGGLAKSLQGQADVPMPPTWAQAFAALEPAADAARRKTLLELAVAFGDQSAFPMLRETLVNSSLPQAEREKALGILSKGNDPDLAPVLHRLLAEDAFRLAALKALGACDHPATPKAIFAVLPMCGIEQKRAAMNALASRASYAGELIAAIESGVLPGNEVPSYVARQIKNLGDNALSQKLAAVWGKIDETPAAIQAEIDRQKSALTPEVLADADLQQGRLVFSQICASCHTLFGAGSKIGPDLTGSNRANLDYILENILNPNALIGRDYQLHIVTLKDGRVLSGMIREETDSAITLQLVDNVTVAPKSQIASSEPVPVSMMPPGLLAALNAEQSRNLIAYLASPAQVPLPEDGPYLDLETGKVAAAIEGESLKITNKPGNAAPQGMGGFPLAKWSGNGQLWWTGGKIGDELETEFNVESAGVREVFAVLTQAIDYGIVQLVLNGELIGNPVDCFNNEVINTGALSFGSHELRTGSNQLTLRITGKNPKATSTMVGVDYIWLKPE